MTNLKLCAALAAIPAVGCVTDDATNPPDQTVVVSPTTATPGTPKTFHPLTNVAPFTGAGAAHLLNNGNVMVQEYFTANWWQLTPDNMGSYTNGTWKQLASSGTYGPLFYASAVLPDDRLIVEGGEYNGNATFVSLGAIYDPATNKWTNITAPAGWSIIGDASGLLMPNGTFVLSSCCDDGVNFGSKHAPLATLDPVHLTWTDAPMVGPTKESSSNDEESWCLLPDDTVLTIDAENVAKPTESEILDLNALKWSSGGSTIVRIADNDNTGGANPSFEEGPIMLRQDGVVFAIGTTSHTASYDTHTKTWKAGPEMPKNAAAAQLGSKDGPGVVLPNGNMLVALSPAPLGDENFPVGINFYEFDGTTFTQVPGNANAANNGSYQNNFLVLPTGEIMMTDQSSDIELYTPAPGAAAGAAPFITSAPRLVSASDTDPIVPFIDTNDDLTVDAETGLQSKLLPLATIHPGRTYKLAGTQLNGLTQGAYYGDDEQSFTNRPIFRVTSMASGHVRYLNAHHSSNYGIAPGLQTTTHFDVPADTELGVSTLEVVASGIPSPPIVVNIK